MTEEKSTERARNPIASPRKPALLGGRPTFDDPVYIVRALAPEKMAFSKRVDRVLSSRWFSNDGEQVRELERRLAERLGIGFCAAFCNGTVALEIALRSLDLSGEVVTTPFTFPATVHAIEWNGLTPVFCDVDARTYNMSPERAAELVSPQTRALLPVHVFGNPCDVVAFEELAGSRGLKTIYDAAHAWGVSHLQRSIGSWGDLSMFSFHATKLFHTAEGGAVVGSDPELLERLRSLRNFGIVDEEHVSGVGLNGKLSEIHAALGLSLLDRADEEIRARERLTQRYSERLSGVEGVAFQSFAPETVRNYSYLTIEIDEATFGMSRDELHGAMRAENIIARKYFYPLCSENEAYRHLPTARPEHLPNAHRLASRILCLPLYGELGLDDVDRIADALLAIQAAAPAIRGAGGPSR